MSKVLSGPDYLILLFVTLFSLAIYGNVLGNGFVYDDTSVLVNNPWIKDTKYITDIFLKDVWGFNGETLRSHHYRPLLHLIYMFGYHAFGISAAGFHAVNILFHAGSSILVYLLVKTLTYQAKDRADKVTFPALVAALFFAAHPIHTEAVAWISSLTELSFSFFFLLSFFWYVTWHGRSFRTWYVLSLLAFSLALLCKETALTLPVVLISHDLYFKQEKESLQTVRKRIMPFIVIAGLYLVLRGIVLGGFAPRNVHTDLSGYQYSINVFPLFSWYLMKLLLPLNLNVFHDLRPLNSLLDLSGILSIAVATGFVVGVIMLRKNRLALLGALLFALTLVPALYIPALGEAFVAERYLYLPSFGFVMMIAAGVEKVSLFRSQTRNALIAILLIINAIFAGAAIERNTVWKDNFTLFSDSVEKSPFAALPRTNLGNAYIEKENIEEAITQFEIATRLKPTAVEPHANLGFAYMAQGRIPEALREYNTVLWINPGHPMALQYYSYLMRQKQSVEKGRKSSGELP